jgi:hypothetical protein
MTSLDQLRARFARNEGLPFADVLTEASIHDALNAQRALDRVRPGHDHLGFPVVLSDDHAAGGCPLLTGG